MEFVEGKIAEEKVFGVVVFPKTLNPPMEEEGRSEVLVEMIREEREWLQSEALGRHSAVLFRGFGVSSPEEFGRVVDAFGWEDMPYFGAVSRTKLADRVCTANESPLHQAIAFHHEMSTPSPKGGETSILPSNIILEKMEDRVSDFVSKLLRLGYIFQTKTAKSKETNTVISKTWQWLFKTEGKVEAQKRAKEKLRCSFVRFSEDGSAEFVYGPLNPIKEFEEKRVWFHHLVGRNEGDTDNYFGDGTPLPRAALDAYRTTINENCVDINWQKGDVLLVDNFCVQHARRAGEAPRLILVSVCK